MQQEENAITFNVRTSDVIIGGIGIIAASGMLGEITPAMAQAVSESPAIKILIPVSRLQYNNSRNTGQSIKRADRLSNIQNSKTCVNKNRLNVSIQPVSISLNVNNYSSFISKLVTLQSNGVSIV